jgi:16S rRNA (cytidine1402-2'-O)-methyltransferase
MPAVLYIVATPIGNLSDITFRAVETLKTVDAVACEDTRRTEKLLSHLGVSRPMIRYDEHTHEFSSRKIIDQLRAGKTLALVSDAGTPAVSDPGARLVAEVTAAGIPVIPIPGPSAVATAMSASGFSGDGFVFLGFLPRRPGRARRLLQEALGLGKTVLFFESPFRARESLEMIASLAPASRVAAARELTKIHEEFLRGSPLEVLELLKTRPEKGEFVILIAPVDATEASDASEPTS